MIKITPAHSFNYLGTTLVVFHADKGEGLIKHQHEYNHASYCTSGSLIIRVEGKELVMTKETQPIDLKANHWHEIEALEDNTVFTNVFAIQPEY